MSDWRERSGGAGPRPRSVDHVVRAVGASLRSTHAVESGLFFVAGMLLARSAALLSQAPGGGAWGVALLCGALAAAAWWLEHPVDPAALVSALDQRLRHHGALVTAFELEAARSGAAGPLRPRNSMPLNSMETLVRERVLTRLRTGEALHAVLPPLLVPIAAPVLAGLALVLALDARRAPEPAAVDYLALAEGLEGALSLGALDPETAGLTGEDGDGGLSREQHREIATVLGARSRLPFSAEGWQRDPAGTRERIEELDRAVVSLAAQVDPGSALHRRLEEARPWLDALRTALAGQGGPGGEGTASASLTDASPDGTIFPPHFPSHPGPSGPASAPATPSTSAASVPGPVARALGLQAGNWWPAEYDAVVERWVELSRAAHPGAEEQDDP